jgi:AcrR family transcriptional regulator
MILSRNESKAGLDTFVSYGCFNQSFTMPMEMPVTRDRVCNAAERLFGENSFSNTSLRQITAEAGVNLAAVNYHFGSKEDLYREVLQRRLRPMNAERLTLLTQAEQLAGDQPVPVRAVLDTFIRPLLRRAVDAAAGGRWFLRLISRDLTDPLPFIRDEIARELEPLVARYTHALGQARPDLPRSELFWRMQFAIGAILYTAAHQHDVERLSQGLCRSDDLDGCIRRLVDFCTAGLDAPPATVET